MNSSPNKPVCKICHPYHGVSGIRPAITTTTTTTSTATDTTAATAVVAARGRFGINPRVVDPPIFTSVQQPQWTPEPPKDMKPADQIVGPGYMPPEQFVTAPAGPERLNRLTSIFGAVRQSFGNIKMPTWKWPWSGSK